MRMLRTFLYAVIFALAATLPAQAKTLSIVIDQSVSNPLVLDKAYAKMVARYAQAQISTLQLGDWLHIRHFGDRSAAHFLSEKIRITRGMRADKAAAMVAGFIASLPSKQLQGQRQTNIIAVLEFGQFDCDKKSRVLLLTDGIESSALMNERDLLSGNKPLPPPDEKFLSGCEVTMMGVGQSIDGSLTPQAVKHLRAAWTAWMKQAGASPFTVIIDP